MNGYKVTSTTTNGDVETELIDAPGPIEAAFLLGVEFGVGSTFRSPEIFELSKAMFGPVGATRSFADSVRKNLDSMVVEEV